jgi:hypothetical protein
MDFSWAPASAPETVIKNNTINTERLNCLKKTVKREAKIVKDSFLEN